MEAPHLQAHTLSITSRSKGTAHTELIREARSASQPSESPGDTDPCRAEHCSMHFIELLTPKSDQKSGGPRPLLTGAQYIGGSLESAGHLCWKLQLAAWEFPLAFLPSLSSFSLLRTMVLLYKVNYLLVIVPRTLSVSSLCLRTKDVKRRISANNRLTYPTPLFFPCLQKRLVPLDTVC
jgi:hypothetical protein